MSTGIFPKIVKIKQTFPRPMEQDIAGAMAREIKKLLEKAHIGAGQKVGLTVGSRGIQNITVLLKAAIEMVQSFGAQPFLLSAMGSHGGGTKQGQSEMLASLGITPALGAPILTCIDGREIGITQSNLHVYMLETAFEMDAIIPINRVKTHTSFKGDYESGLLKKLVVGLGGPQGAKQFHSQGKVEFLSPLLRDVGEVIIEKMPIIGGIAIVENAYEETALIQGIYGEDILIEEPKVLLHSKTLLPSLPVKNLDALIVETMGKNFSGTGMDTNVIGRLYIQGEGEPKEPFVRYLSVMGLSEDSHGNACGIGLADFTTTSLVEQIDRKATYLNCLTATFPIRAKIPVYFDTEREVLESMFMCLQGSVSAQKVKLVIIPNTLFLETCYVSEGALAELQGNDTIQVVGELEPMTFDSTGRLQQRLSHVN